MRVRARVYLSLFAFSLSILTFVVSSAQAALTYALIDRKFPGGTFCPIETRNGQLVTFQAPTGGSVRITFLAANEYPNDEGQLDFNDPAIDNVYVMPLPYWNGGAYNCNSTCFTADFAFGGSGYGALNFPPSAEAHVGFPLAEQFQSDPHQVPDSPWDGGTWYDEFTAPHEGSVMSCSGGFGTGSLRLGHEAVGDQMVSASVTVSGLEPDATYVVFCWFRVNVTRESGPIRPAYLEIVVDDASPIAVRERSFSAVKALFR